MKKFKWLSGRVQKASILKRPKDVSVKNIIASLRFIGKTNKMCWNCCTPILKNVKIKKMTSVQISTNVKNRMMIMLWSCCFVKQRILNQQLKGIFNKIILFTLIAIIIAPHKNIHIFTFLMDFIVCKNVKLLINKVKFQQGAFIVKIRLIYNTLPKNYKKS